ncbi:MAG TPA: thiamine pyrophosphate-dependent dehydrogenase E1 component subunit alpha, partial [Candidatus Acidoferrum sp.]|nr:thiamine pyrophosphate-dependent dehydrogenase E1 component subunit alpha [Candidatus Acidoferrum sp.]
MELDKQKLLQMYRNMLRIRRFEERLAEESALGNIPGLLHLYVGEEAVAVGACSALRKDDYITSTHRGHGHCIAKGGDLRKMMAELFGKETGYCKGRGGSMHIAAPEIGIVGCSAIAGAGIPIAAGVGLSSKLRGTDQVCVSFFGDGASNTGAFHEGMNLASLWELPVVYVLENNL